MGSGIWMGQSRSVLSLFHDVWGLSCETHLGAGIICRLPSLHVWHLSERTQRPASTGTVNRSTCMWPSPVTGVSHGVAAGSEIEHQRRDIQKASLLRKLGGSCVAFQAQPRKSPSPRHITGCKYVTVASLHSRARKWDSAFWWGLACGMRDVVMAIFGKCSLPQGTSLQQPSTAWVGNIPWRRACNPLQYSCLKNPMDRRAWQATVHEVTKSRIGLRDWAHTYCQGNGAVTEGCSLLTAPLPTMLMLKGLLGPGTEEPRPEASTRVPKSLSLSSLQSGCELSTGHAPASFHSWAWWLLHQEILQTSLTGWGFASFSNLWATS